MQDCRVLGPVLVLQSTMCRFLGSGLAARGQSPTACDRRCIPPGRASRRPAPACPDYGQVSRKPWRRRIVSRSKTAGMLPRRALRGPDAASPATTLAATLDFRPGLLALSRPHGPADGASRLFAIHRLHGVVTEIEDIPASAVAFGAHALSGPLRPVRELFDAANRAKFGVVLEKAGDRWQHVVWW